MPRILVTNDDGVRSPGLAALAHALAEVGDVFVVAPARQQSAVSHKITLGEPLRARAVRENWMAVTGTPADAVFLSLHKLLDAPPDLVVSGINHGVNLGTDIFYSGTLAGALEAALKGIPAFAVSQQLPHSPAIPPEADEDTQKANWWDPIRPTDGALAKLMKQAARFAAGVARELIARPLPAPLVLNINCPNRPTNEYRWTRVGNRVYRGEVIERLDPRGIPYYWIGGPAHDVDEPVGTDSYAVNNGVISLCALSPRWGADPVRPIADAQWTLEGFSELEG